MVMLYIHAVQNLQHVHNNGQRWISRYRQKNEHTCDPNTRKSEAHLLWVRVQKQTGDISSKPASTIRSQLQEMEENELQPKDLYNASIFLYRERRKNMPAFLKKKTRMETIDAFYRSI